MTPNSNGWCWRSGLVNCLAIFGAITSLGASSLTQATSDVKLGSEISGLEVFVAQAAPPPPPPAPSPIPDPTPIPPPSTLTATPVQSPNQPPNKPERPKPSSPVPPPKQP